MKQPKLVDTVFMIRDTESGKFVVYNNKAAWISVVAAKLSYSVHNYDYKTYTHLKFDEQTCYEIVELHA